MKNLKLFTQPEILHRIGARRLGILLRPFAAELQAINFPMPPPDEPDGNGYFHVLAEAISRADALPWSVRRALVTIETAAAPESNAHLEDAILRRLRTVSLPANFILDRALEVWFVAPEELARFVPVEDVERRAGEMQQKDAGKDAGAPRDSLPLTLSPSEGAREKTVSANCANGHDERSASGLPAPIENGKSNIENPPRSDVAAPIENQKSKIEKAMGGLSARMPVRSNVAVMRRAMTLTSSPAWWNSVLATERAGLRTLSRFIRTTKLIKLA